MKKLEGQLRAALALAGDLYTIDDIVAAAEERRMQVWGDDDGVIVTVIEHFPRGRLLHLIAGAGDRRRLIALEPKLEEFARDHGCSAMHALGRPEWGRVAAHRGWKPWAMAFVKRLEAVN